MHKREINPSLYDTVQSLEASIIKASSHPVLRIRIWDSVLFYPLNLGSGINFFRTRIPDMRPVLSIRDVLSRIWIRTCFHPGSCLKRGMQTYRYFFLAFYGFRSKVLVVVIVIPDPGGKKAPDPDPQHLRLWTSFFFRLHLY
jgi:hypothetical protein